MGKHLFCQKKTITPSRQFTAIVKQGKFNFKIDSIKRYSYISLGNGRFRGHPYFFLDLFTIQPGDNINIEIRPNNTIESRDKIITKTDDHKTVCLNCDIYRFSGIGALKFQYRWNLYKAKDSLQNVWYDSAPIAQREVKSSMDNTRRAFSQMSFVKKKELMLLTKYTGKIPEDMYQLLKADAMAQCNDLFFANLVVSYVPEQITQAEQLSFKNFYLDTVKNLIEDHISENLIAASAYYPASLIFKERLENKAFFQGSNYNRLKKNYKGTLRDRLLTNYLIESLNKSGVDSLINDATKVIHDAKYANVLTAAQANSQIGTNLDFKLPDIKGKMVALSDFKGKIVFIDFWFVGCGGCASFYQSSLSKAEEHFKKNSDIIFLTITIDIDKSKWLDGIRSNKYTSLNAINLQTGNLGATHPLIKKLNITSYPTLIVVDRNGNIAINNTDLLRNSNSNSLIELLTKVL